MINREKLKAVYFRLLRWARRDAGLLRQIRERNHLVVLSLHRVAPQPNPYWEPLHPRLFEDLLVFLKRHFCVVLFRDLAVAAADATRQQPLAILSFDDGYSDFIEYAVPLLEKHKLAANQNIIPACVESGEPIWNIKLYDFLNAAPKSLVDEIRLPGFDFRLMHESHDAKVQYGLQISRFFKDRPQRERAELWSEIAPLMQRMEVQYTRMLTRNQVRELAARHEIGVHSFSHESMEFEDDSFFNADLAKCQAYFATSLKLPLEIYAFPNGSFRAAQIETLRHHGIKHVLLVGEAFAQTSGDVYPRFTIYGATPAEVRLRALGFKQRKA